MGERRRQFLPGAGESAPALARPEPPAAERLFAPSASIPGKSMVFRPDISSLAPHSLLRAAHASSRCLAGACSATLRGQPCGGGPDLEGFRRA